MRACAWLGALIAVFAIPATALAAGDQDVRDCADRRNTEKTIAACTRIIEEGTEREGVRAGAHTNRGLAYESLQRQTDSISDYRKALLLNPSNRVALEGVHRLGPGLETAPFSSAELLSGKRMTEGECGAMGGTVWVVVDRKGECIRYYHAAPPNAGSEALVVFSQDVMNANNRGDLRPMEYYLKLTPAAMADLSARWSRSLRMPFIFLARPGTYGSSGEHTKLRTTREIELISAAIDAIKVRHGYTRLHLSGFSRAGHAAAALLGRRTDLGCVVLASSLLSVRSYLAEFGRDHDVTGNRNPLDPITLLDQVVKRPELRILVLTDPDDFIISARSQTAYVKRARAAGLPIQQIFSAAPDTYAHNVWQGGAPVAADCARGTSDDAIVTRYQNKVPETPPDADDPPLHTPAVLSSSVVVSETRCKNLRSAVWVRVEGMGYCVRYWLSNAGSRKDEALLFIHGDLGDAKAPNALNRASAVITSGFMQRDAQRWSRDYGGPFIAVGRLGAFGSSGDHRKRRTTLEIRVLTAAMDELKVRHGITRFHLAGQSGGAHTVAGLVQMRDDVRCAVMAAGSLALKLSLSLRGIKNVIGFKDLYDPIDFVAAMQRRPGQRMIVLSDPDDKIVPFRPQREFVVRTKAKGLSILHITADAGTDDHHGLATEAKNVAIDCAKDMDDDALIAKYQNKNMPLSGGAVATRSR